ncbi:MAG: CPBP family intramembrane glutamic endopeptidase [Thermacetogeniaceae bacterium]
MSRKTLLAFFGLTFLLNWGLWGLLVFSPQFRLLTGITGPDNPVFIVVGGCAPTIAALFLVSAVYGPSGLGSFLARLLRWNVGIWWYVGLTALFVGLDLFVRLVTTLTGGYVPAISYSPALSVPLALLTLVTTTGPLGEELGWRGLALPLLQRRYSPLAASLILGCIWGAWHIPAFLFSGSPQSINTFPLYFIYILCGTILMTAVYNATGGSLPLLIIVHWLFNLNGAMAINGIEPLGVGIMCAVLLAAALVISLSKPGAIFTEPVAVQA